MIKKLWTSLLYPRRNYMNGEKVIFGSNSCCLFHMDIASLIIGMYRKNAVNSFTIKS